MTWAEALLGVDVVESAGASGAISGIEYDSRRVRSGTIFVAIRGCSAAGKRLPANALSQGAAGIVTDSQEFYDGLRQTRADVPAALVAYGRRALAGISANIF